jgi:hypothetical protein
MAFKKFADFINEQKLPGKTEQPLGKKGKLPTQKRVEDRGTVTADDNRGIPLGEKGMEGMTPKNAMPLGEKPAGAPKSLKHSKGKMPKHMKNESFFKKTANLSDAQFTAKLLENQKISQKTIHSLDGKPFTPEPAETLRYVVQMALQNEALLSRLIREMKRNNGLNALVTELFKHNETFSIISEIADQRLIRKLNEAVAEPRGMSGGSPAGPSGATAGNVPMVKNGGGVPTPPSEGEETPEGGGGMLDDNEGEDGEGDEEEKDDLGIEAGDDDEDEDDDMSDGKHNINIKHHHGDIHNHHHHHNGGGDKMSPPPMIK